MTISESPGIVELIKLRDVLVGRRQFDGPLVSGLFQGWNAHCSRSVVEEKRVL